MNPSEVAPADLREGINDPSPISRVVVLDWYDGPIGGVLQIGNNGPAYRFALLDERQSADEADVRVYGLCPVPSHGFERLADGLSQHSKPRWPVWVPVWQFPTDESRQDMESLADDIVNRAGPLTWVVIGDVGNGPVRTLPVRAARAS